MWAYILGTVFAVSVLFIYSATRVSSEISRMEEQRGFEGFLDGIADYENE